MSDLLKEAIADAKAVRETALENAKIALEEAFTPQLKSMLSAKLKEDEFEDEEDIAVDDEEEVPAENPEEISYEDDEFGGDDEGEEFSDEEGGGEENPFADDEEEVEENIIELNGQSFRLVPIQEDDVYESEESNVDKLDLESVIKELETEINEEDDIEEGKGDKEEEDDAKLKEISKDRNEGDPSGPAKDGSNSTNEDVEIDESVLDEDEELDETKEEVDEEVDETSGIGKGTGRGSTDRSSAIGGSGQEKAKKFESVQAELDEYKEAVSFLKDKLHEVNILNAKLLFTNKLFKEYVLDNNQKLKVVETFDRAQTTREIKLIYSTLAEQFGDNGAINKKSINESASTAVSSTKPSKESKKVITEETQVADRFRKLAGLVK